MLCMFSKPTKDATMQKRSTKICCRPFPSGPSENFNQGSATCVI